MPLVDDDGSYEHVDGLIARSNLSNLSQVLFEKL